MIASAESYAQELGWTDIEAEDTGAEVTMLLSAPGACEQMVTAPLSKIRMALKDWGGPELYPATDTYDLPEEEENVEAGEAEYDFEEAELEPAPEEETVYVEQAETQEELDAALEEARMEPRPAEDSSVVTPAGEMHNHREELEPTLKDLYESAQGGISQDRGGVPNAEDYLEPAVPAEEELLMPGGKIVARRGDEVMRFGFAIQAGVKSALEADGWVVTHLVKKEAAVAITEKGAYVDAGEGRQAKADGAPFTISKGNKSFVAQTAQVEMWLEAGWTVQ